MSATLRGAYLDMCCDIEFVLVDMICVCLVKEPNERKNVKECLMEGLMMNKKITLAERALKKYNCTYFEKYKDCFTTFKRLATWRNKFAHSRIKGEPNEQDATIVIFEYIEGGIMVEKEEKALLLFNKLQEYAS